jgi:hypothetical protein
MGKIKDLISWLYDNPDWTRSIMCDFNGTNGAYVFNRFNGGNYINITAPSNLEFLSLRMHRNGLNIDISK